MKTTFGSFLMMITMMNSVFAMDGATESCRDVVEGEQCYTEVKWAMETGFRNNPEWYGSLTSTSSFAEFQDYFYQNSNLGKNGNSCPKPCLPVDCVGSWGEFGDCTSTCGGGTQTKTYTVQTQAANGGAACPDVQTETQACNTDACPVDCVGSWGEYGDCTATCGEGTQTKTYTVETQAANGGAACPEVQTETQTCNLVECPIDCVGEWGEYGDCTSTCGGGTQTKTYTVETEAANGGVACPAVQTETQACNTDECPKWTTISTNTNVLCGKEERMASWKNFGVTSSLDECAQLCYDAEGCTHASFRLNDRDGEGYGHCTGFTSCDLKPGNPNEFDVVEMTLPKVRRNVEMNPDEPQDVQRSLELEF